MFHTSRTNRLAAAYLGAGVITLLALSGTASALGDDTETDETARVDVGYAKHGNGEPQADHPDDAPANWRRLLNQIDTPLTSTESPEAPRADRSDACLPTPDDRAGGECVFDQRYLPHTADAVDGWYRSCRSRQ